MSDLTIELFCTVDGFAAGTDSPAYFGYDGPDLSRWIEDRIHAPQVIVMGRKTYTALADHGAAEADDPLSVRMTETPKLVFSSTLTEPPVWANTTVIAEDPAVVLARMKQEDGDPLRVIGSLSLGCSLIALGLVDRICLLTFPLLLGDTGAEPIFAEVGDQPLRLAGTEVLDGRLLYLDYRID